MTILDELAASSRDLMRDLDPVKLLRRAEEVSRTRTRHRFRRHLAGRAMFPRLIAEIKAASPSAGPIAADPDVAAIAAAYRRGGAAAISVVAEPLRFQGSTDWIAPAAESSGLPVLMKHFVTDERLALHGVASGAEAILLIAALLQTDAMRRLITMLDELGVDALVEVHDEEEIDRALDAGARILGVNNRDLRNFTVDLGTSERLIGRIPRECLRVAESGIRSRGDALRLARAGFDAVLVGEHLLRQSNHETAARELAGPPAVKICGITRVEDAETAAEAGAAFIGLVFAPGSPRRLEPSRSRAIADAARGRNPALRVVGVFRDQTPEEVSRISDEAGVDLIQLHGDEEAERFAGGRPIIRAVRVGKAVPRLASDQVSQWILFDHSSPSGGGAGVAFDWSILDSTAHEHPRFLAGGLNPGNVAAAIRRVRPEAVDVSTGVETSPGIKSAEKIRAFIEEVNRT
ncbi:MAG TPA: bifunctional indole-3-glycerol phosphate synthase/phosphoribosylanthranilate isomerase [Thermoanaerobaculia bacterium]|nr:bifunctional indole-3-glycerol phosphate synthase/phosphoribosylanthranilate isomerase [Thermoanaerobaculia bacterium]